MDRITNYLRNYLGVSIIVLSICMLLTYSLSYFKATTDSKRAAEMYIGELKYTLSIDGTSTNTLTVQPGETIVNMNITNINDIDTFYKVIYEKNSNIEIKYYDKTKDTDENITNYDSPLDKILVNASKKIKLAIQNNSTSEVIVNFIVSGGYSTNTLSDVIVPTNYTEINTKVTENQYFCTTTDTLNSGLEYVNGQYTYKYMYEGNETQLWGSQFTIEWRKITTNGWGVLLTDRKSTDEVRSKVCTYINDKPIVSMSFMFFSTYAKYIDLSSFNTRNVNNMAYMFYSLEDWTHSPTPEWNVSTLTGLDLSTFDTSNVTNMKSMFQGNQELTTIYVSDKFTTSKVTDSTSMFYDDTRLVGGSGTVYDENNDDKTYARIDGGTSSPGYFTDIGSEVIPEPVSFSTDSWKTIFKAAKIGNISKYKVGDTKTVSMGTYGNHTLRLANITVADECTENSNFSQTACGFVVEFADIIGTSTMANVNSLAEGWEKSPVRTLLNNGVYNSLPAELRNVIIDTKVVSGRAKSDTSNYVTTDKLYLLAGPEIYKNWADSGDASRGYTRQLDYYSNLGVTISNYSGAIKKYNNSALSWWHRSAHAAGTYLFFKANENGSSGSESSTMSNGLSPAFRLN